MHQDSWHHLGSLESEDLFEWIHICLKIDMVKETMSASIDGKEYGVTKVVGMNPSHDIDFNIRLGIVDYSNSGSKFQFHGKITNIHLFLPNAVDIANLTKNLCFNRANISILSWSDMKWKFSGNKLKEVETNSNLVCPTSPYADLTIPLMWNKRRAVDMCSKLGNGKITTFSANVSIMNTSSIDDNECERYWTPYSYSVEEGKVTDEITKLEEKLFWWRGFPVNISDSSEILFYPEEGQFMNTVQKKEECLICNTSLKTMYTLRGNCKNSFLGNSNYKTNTLNKYLGFFGKRVTIW